MNSVLVETNTQSARCFYNYSSFESYTSTILHTVFNQDCLSLRILSFLDCKKQSTVLIGENKVAMLSNTTYLLCNFSLNISGANVYTRGPSSAMFAVFISLIVAVAPLTPVAVEGNGLVLAAIWRNPSLRTPSYILLAGLAIADCCTGLITQPLYITNELTALLELSKDYSMTLALGFLCFEYFGHVSIFTVTVMSIERWLHMARQSLVTVRRARVILAVLVLLPIPLVVQRLASDFSSSYENYVANFSVFLVCIFVTSTAYFKVFRIVRRHQQQIHPCESPENFATPATNFKKYTKSVFSILYIVIIFYVSYFPLLIHLGLLLFYLRNKDLIELSFNMIAVLIFSSSSLNPLLYLWRMKDIRSEVALLVKRILRKDS